MERSTYISKGAAGAVVGALVVGMCAVSGYAFREPVPRTSAATTPHEATVGADTLKISNSSADPDQASTRIASARVDEATAAHIELMPSPNVTAPEKSSRGIETDDASRERRVLQFLATGRASFYGFRFEGRPTANGESFDPQAMTAAHRTLPFGTHVRVTNVTNGRSVDVRINDRGPFTKGRIIDLSRGAAEKLGMIRSGTAKVTLELLQLGS